jgi:dTDP-4-amino-4,6-dideoxygalactose transaminase
LGLAQLKRLSGWVAARQRIARLYDEALAGLAEAVALKTRADRTHAHHLYVIRLLDGIDRDRVFARLRAEAIGANVHYAPVYLHSHYARLGYRPGLCPNAEASARQILTLPMFPAMSEADVRRVVGALTRATA